MSAAQQPDESDQLLPLPVAMRPDEIALFRGVLATTRHYVEFGAGGSTYLAAQTARSIVSVESSRAWIDKVAKACASHAEWTQPVMVHADIGPVRDLGYPDGELHRDLWPSYCEAMRGHPGTGDADTYLVDGRFRLACCAQVMIDCHGDAIMLVHDFANRPAYAAVHRIAREVARVGNLSAFVRRHDFDVVTALDILKHHRFDPA